MQPASYKSVVNIMLLNLIAICCVMTAAVGGMISGIAHAAEAADENQGELITTITALNRSQIITINERFEIAEQFKSVDINGVPIVLRKVPYPQDAKIIYQISGSGNNMAIYVEIQAAKDSWAVPE